MKTHLFESVYTDEFDVKALKTQCGVEDQIKDGKIGYPYKGPLENHVVVFHKKYVNCEHCLELEEIKEEMSQNN